MTGIRRLRSLEPERRRGGQGNRGVGRGGCYSGSRTGRGGRDVGGICRDMYVFFFFFAASSASSRQDGESRTNSKHSFFFLLMCGSNGPRECEGVERRSGMHK